MKLNYQTYGDEEPTLLILHGLLGSQRNWHTVARELAKQFQIIVPDLRNHGESPHGPHSIDLMCEDVENLIDDLVLNRVILLGHSMGGLVAMRLAARHPDMLLGLIVEDIAPGVPIEGNEWILEAMLELDLGSVTTREQADQTLALKIENRSVRQFLLQNLFRKNNSYGWRCNLPELLRFVRTETGVVKDAAGIFRGPTLFIGGGKSEYKLEQRKHDMVRHFPGAELLMIPNAGHWVHFDAAAEFQKAVQAFVRNLLPA